MTTPEEIAQLQLGMAEFHRVGGYQSAKKLRPVVAIFCQECVNSGRRPDAIGYVYDAEAGLLLRVRTPIVGATWQFAILGDSLMTSRVPTCRLHGGRPFPAAIEKVARIAKLTSKRDTLFC